MPSYVGNKAFYVYEKCLGILETLNRNLIGRRILYGGENFVFLLDTNV